MSQLSGEDENVPLQAASHEKLTALKLLKSILTRGLGFIGLERVARSVWKRIRWFGFRYRCPMCAANLRAFLPGGETHAVLAEKSIVGGGLRANMTCPICLSDDRQRSVYLHLKNRPHMLARGARLLHVAPERNLGAWLRSLPELDYTSADLERTDVDLKIDLTDIALSVQPLTRLSATTLWSTYQMTPKPCPRSFAFSSRVAGPSFRCQFR